MSETGERGRPRTAGGDDDERIIPRPAGELAADTEALVKRGARSPHPQPARDEASAGPRRRLLGRLHRLVLDRLDAGPERISTAGETPLEGLTIAGPNGPSGHAYRPTPRRLIRWLLSDLPVSPGSFALVDLGSGRGRVVLEGARLPFRHVVGIEFAEELHEDASTNLRHWPRWRMACRNVDLVHADAAEAALPPSDIVAWLFDPFDHRMTTRIAARLADHARRHRVLVVFVDAGPAIAFRESTTFRPVPLPPTIRGRIRAWSPHEVELFAAGDAGND